GVNYASGLAAAYGGGSREQELGALADTSAWQISSLDGSPDDVPTTTRDPDELTATATQPATGNWAGADPFAPPEEEREVEVDLAAAAPAPAPPPSVPANVTFTPRPAPAGSSAMAATPPATSGLGLLVEKLASGRPHFAVGVFLAVLLGFVPAHLVASAREGTYDELADRVTAQIQEIDSPETWDTAATVREAARSTIASRRTNIAVSSAVVWALSFAGLLYAWRRLIDWDRLIWLAGRVR